MKKLLVFVLGLLASTVAARECSVYTFTGGYSNFPTAVGSGFNISPKRVVTCRHVVNNLNDPLYVQFQGEEPIRVSYFICSEMYRDFALLILSRPTTAPSDRITSEPVRPGDFIRQVGYPGNSLKPGEYKHTETTGTVGVGSYGMYLQISDVPTSAGFSGSPVYDEDSLVVGIDSNRFWYDSASGRNDLLFEPATDLLKFLEAINDK